MTTAVADLQPRGSNRIVRGFRGFWSGISAVGTKEIRGRMRGRRAFVILTVYLLLLSIFAFAVYQYMRNEAERATDIFGGSNGIPIDPGFGRPGFIDGSSFGTTGTALSATIGHGIFSGLLLLETVLILVLAPAFTSGAISLEREKQTLDLLVATPLSTFGMVLGKLLSALAWVFLLIIASIPLASLVFAFGGVGPEDLVRGYVLLFAVAFGMGAIGLFISAIVRRSQSATVVAFLVVLALTIGTGAVHAFMLSSSQSDTTNGFVTVQTRQRAPEALLWLNPLVGDLDLICTTAPVGFDRECSYVAAVTGKPYFGSSSQSINGCPIDAPCFPPTDDVGGVVPGGIVTLPMPVVINGDGSSGAAPGAVGGDGKGGVAIAPDATLPDPSGTSTLTLGFPRDTFWPRSALAFVLTGLVLVLLSTQLIAPSRRLRLPRLRGRRAAIALATTAATTVSIDETTPEVAPSDLETAEIMETPS